jgi:HAD superfamily hydrolase (TIGR01662 family)
MGVEVVYFDLGDTLWHFPKMPPPEIVRGETMKRVGALVTSWGYDMREGDRRMLGRDIRFAVEEETSRAFHGDCVDPGYPDLCRRIAAMHGMDLTVEQGAELWESWNLGGLFLGRELFPDVLETLRALRDRGYRLASITNRGYSGPRFQEEMAELGLTELFEHVAVSCDVGYMKPHPRLFQYAMEQMGVAAEDCVMVGDSLRADVEGAKTLGMITIWRRPPTGEPLEPATDEPEAGAVSPDYVVDEIGQMRALPIFQPGGSTAK